MPRYFFNIKDGFEITDEVGVVLPHFPAARLEAIRRAGEVLRDNAFSATIGDDWSIKVQDESGLNLFVVTIMVQEAPAIIRHIHVTRSP